jgi:hypothetical protein
MALPADSIWFEDCHKIIFLKSLWTTQVTISNVRLGNNLLNWKTNSQYTKVAGTNLDISGSRLNELFWRTMIRSSHPDQSCRQEKTETVCLTNETSFSLWYCHMRLSKLDYNPPMLLVALQKPTHLLLLCSFMLCYSWVNYKHFSLKSWKI